MTALTKALELMAAVSLRCNSLYNMEPFEVTSRGIAFIEQVLVVSFMSGVFQLRGQGSEAFEVVDEGFISFPLVKLQVLQLHRNFHGLEVGNKLIDHVLPVRI